jgi:hypothetical protein
MTPTQSAAVAAAAHPVAAGESAGWKHRVALGVGWFFALFCIFDGAARIVHFAPYVEGLVKYGYAPELGPWIGATLIACTVLYLVPRTAVLGAVALSAYLGGAVAAHLSVGEVFWFPVMTGVVFWWSLWVRDARVREVLPVGREGAA